jgi:hypothetical protein
MSIGPKRIPKLKKKKMTNWTPISRTDGLMFVSEFQMSAGVVPNSR